ncbi:MAG: response regulator [Deltaproteobacteria bacterium]|nr:response regulator [Deltaproteobacteria bacterium]
MAYRLTYPDKYRLWNDLVRGSADRLFIATDEQPPLGGEVAVEIQVSDHNLYFVVSGRVIGRRGRSRRFEPGVFVRVEAESLKECQAYLGMECLPELARRARRSLRVHAEVEVRFLSPKADQTGQTRNISQTGLFVTSPVNLVPGQTVKLELALPGGPLPVQAEVVWTDAELGAAGLELPLPEKDKPEDPLRAFIDQTREAQAKGEVDTPKPILVADDEPQILQMISIALSKHGFEVYQARSGQECLEMLRQLSPRLVVMDILMPEIDGAEICKIMRGDAEWVDIPVIFVSALEPNVLHQVAAESGATDYLAKPLALGDLLNLVGEYLKD